MVQFTETIALLRLELGAFRLFGLGPKLELVPGNVQVFGIC
jgi:hypothetical protein